MPEQQQRWRQQAAHTGGCGLGRTRRGQPQVIQALSREKNTQVPSFICPLASLLQENMQERVSKGKGQAGDPLGGTGKAVPSRAQTLGMREH